MMKGCKKRAKINEKITCIFMTSDKLIRPNLTIRYYNPLCSDVYTFDI